MNLNANQISHLYDVISSLQWNLEEEKEIHILSGIENFYETRQLHGVRVYLCDLQQKKALKEMLESEKQIREVEIICVVAPGKLEEYRKEGLEVFEECTQETMWVLVRTKKKIPANNSRYFANYACKYYPCHTNIEHLNCLFCYCPFYLSEKCPGNPHYIEKDGKKIKSCMECTFPHYEKNYDEIIKRMM